MGKTRGKSDVNSKSERNQACVEQSGQIRVAVALSSLIFNRHDQWTKAKGGYA